MKMWLKSKLAILWARLAGGEAVYVKRTWKQKNMPTEIVSIRVKIARIRFDPFSIDKMMSVVGDGREFYLYNNGTISIFEKYSNSHNENGKWTYIDLGKRVEHNLKHFNNV